MSRRSLPDQVLVARHLDAEGRLTSLPVKRDRRLLVLRHLVTAIPRRNELDEFGVNNRLRPFSDDVATLRRLLVDEGLLQRPAPGRYRRPEEVCDAADVDRA